MNKVKRTPEERVQDALDQIRELAGMPNEN
jgi:hypothetical protein